MLKNMVWNGFGIDHKSKRGTEREHLPSSNSSARATAEKFKKSEHRCMLRV